MAVGGRLVWNDPEVEHLLHSEDGPVGRLLGHKGEIVAKGAKRRAPVSPDGSGGRPSGYMRSHIGWRRGKDERGLYVDIESPARTPTGEPYGLFVEVGTKPHVIRSGGDYPLRNRKTGQIFGKVVHHPGTTAQPYLRPALDDLSE